MLIFPELKSLIDDIIKIQPMTVSSGEVFYMDFVCSWFLVYMDQELWLEDDEGGGYYCPEVKEDGKVSYFQYERMLEDWYIFPEWEVKQQEEYVSGLGNDFIERR